MAYGTQLIAGRSSGTTGTWIRLPCAALCSFRSGLQTGSLVDPVIFGAVSSVRTSAAAAAAL